MTRSGSRPPLPNAPSVSQQAIPTMTIPAPLELWRETVLPAWTDYNGHMNLAYYVLIFDHATDAFYDHVGLGRKYREATGGSTFASTFGTGSTGVRVQPAKTTTAASIGQSRRHQRFTTSLPSMGETLAGTRRRMKWKGPLHSSGARREGETGKSAKFSRDAEAQQTEG